MRSAALLLGLYSAAPAAAAFEWDHPSPGSWIAGDSPYRWPAADCGAGWRLDLSTARPWSWPELHANALRAAIGRSRSAFGMSLDQERGGQRLAVVGSLLDLRGGAEIGAQVTGAELDLGWSAKLGWVRVSASATGILQSRGAVIAGAPRTFSTRVRSIGAGAALEGRFEDGTRGRRLLFGVQAPIGPLRLGAGWSTGEPTVRCMAEIRRGRLGLSGGIAWHTELPPSESVTLAIGARPLEP
jgi:hypothetical protein